VSASENPRALIRYALVGGALTVVLLWTAFLARKVLLLIYVGALVAIGLSPLVTAIERRGMKVVGGRVPRWLAILTIYLLIIGVLVGIGLLVFPPLADQARELWQRIPDLVHRAQQWLIERGLLTRELTVREAVEKAPIAQGGDAVGALAGAIWGVVGGIAGLLTILILAFYFLIDADNIVTTLVRLAPIHARRQVDEAFRHVTTRVSAWLAGQMLLAGIIGGSAALALWLMGIPYFYVLALIAAVGELIPIVGPLLAAIPAIAVALSVSPTKALAVAIFYLAQQQFENHVLVPKVMERQVGVSAVMVIIALLIGGTLLGIIGAILAVPTAAILHVLFQELTSEDS